MIAADAPTRSPAAVASPVPLIESVRAALMSVCDPEYPGLSIADLGMVERVAVTDEGFVTAELVPTFGGCPALRYIEADVHDALASLDGVRSVEVVWRRTPLWHPNRLTEHAVAVLNEEFTVAIRTTAGDVVCPVCHHRTHADALAAGPVRCRTVAFCSQCRNPLEVIR